MRFRDVSIGALGANLIWAEVVFLAALGCSQSSRPGADRPASADKAAASPKTESAISASDEAPKPLADADSQSPAVAEPASAAPPTETVELTAAQAPLPLDETPGAELTMPRVSLTQGHAETCRVQVGDQLPDVQLRDLDGHEESLSKLFGPKLTVVLFWNGIKPTGLEELRDLGPDVLSRFSKSGVAVVGINTGDDPQLARELVKQAAARYPNLSDHEGEAFKQVATAKVPRTYLVDSSGKILWFDLEYSRSTRRDLVQAIRFSLAHE